MATQALLLAHVFSATVALLAGALAMSFRKGSGLHTVAGRAFVLAMVAMTTSALVLAALLRPNAGNVMGGCLALYLTLTGWAALQARTTRIRTFEWIMLLFGLTIVIAGIRWGGEAAAAGGKDGYGAGMYFVFGIVSLLFSVADVRMLVRGGVTGSRRLARHLLRIGLAYLMALVSFYPGQAKLFPAEWRETNLMMIPHLAVASVLVAWLVRLGWARIRMRRTAAACAMNAG